MPVATGTTQWGVVSMKRVLIAITCAVLITSYGPAQLLGAFAPQDYVKNGILYYGAAALDCASSTPLNVDEPNETPKDDFSSPKALTLVGSNNAEKVMNFLIGQGFPVPAASGMMGNFSVESTFSPTAINSKSGAFGLAQWLGSRLENLKIYGGTSYNTLEVQVQFLMHELSTSESRAMAIKGISSPADAALFWELTFERSGGAGNALRASRATKIFNEWQAKKSLSDEFLTSLQGGTGGGSGSTETGNQECLAKDGVPPFGTGELEGYALPIGAKFKSDFSTFSGALTKMPCNKSCHHDGTPAYDLGVLGYGGSDPLFNPNSIGAPVYAISDGTITVRSDNPPGPNGQRLGCTQFTLHSSKDTKDWWYGHLALSGAAVTRGQEVTKGQLLGYIGNSTCADKTMPHLHIDSGGGRLSTRNDLVHSVVNGLFIQLPDGSSSI